jgi:hypothetical protein
MLNHVSGKARRIVGGALLPIIYGGFKDFYYIYENIFIFFFTVIPHYDSIK